MTMGPRAPIFGTIPWRRRARRHQHEVDSGEIELLQVLALQGLVAEGTSTPMAARGDGKHSSAGNSRSARISAFAAHIAVAPTTATL